MASFKSDYIFGKKKEVEVLDKIKTFFNDENVKASSNLYSKYDFIGSNLYELKYDKEQLYYHIPINMLLPII